MLDTGQGTVLNFVKRCRFVFGVFFCIVTYIFGWALEFELEFINYKIRENKLEPRFNTIAIFLMEMLSEFLKHLLLRYQFVTVKISMIILKIHWGFSHFLTLFEFLYSKEKIKQRLGIYYKTFRTKCGCTYKRHRLHHTSYCAMHSSPQKLKKKLLFF